MALTEIQKDASTFTMKVVTEWEAPIAHVWALWAAAVSVT